MWCVLTLCRCLPICSVQNSCAFVHLNQREADTPFNLEKITTKTWGSSPSSSPLPWCQRRCPSPWWPRGRACRCLTSGRASRGRRWLRPRFWRWRDRRRRGCHGSSGGSPLCSPRWSSGDAFPWYLAKKKKKQQDYLRCTFWIRIQPQTKKGELEAHLWTHLQPGFPSLEPRSSERCQRAPSSAQETATGTDESS